MYSPCQMWPGIASWNVRSARLYLLCRSVVRRLIQKRPGILPSIDPAPPYAPGAPGSSSGGSRLTSMFGLTTVLKARGICARIQSRRFWMNAMISARPLSPSGNL